MTSLEIMQTVARWHGLTWEEFCSKHRFSEYVQARREAWFLCALLTTTSYDEMARQCGFHGSTTQQSAMLYRGPDRSSYIRKGIDPPDCGRRLPVSRAAIYCRRYAAKIKQSDPDKYRKFTERRRARFDAWKERQTAHV